MKKFFEKFLPSHREKSKQNHHIVLAATTLTGVALLQLAFAGVYLGAFHAPKAHELPIAIVGDEATTKQLGESLEQKSDHAYKSISLTDTTAAEAQLKNQEVYAIYQPAFPQATITVASANGKSLVQPITQSLTQLDQAYQAQARQTLAAQPDKAPLASQAIVAPNIHDAAPLPAGDSNGATLFYIAFSAVFGGYLAAVAVNLVRGKRNFSRRLAYIRIAGFALFSVVVSLGVGLIAVYGVDAVAHDHYWTIVGIASLTTFGVSLIASSLVSLLGVFGTALVILLFVVLGTPASGGPVPLPLTGEGLWQTLAPLLPTGAAFGALRQSVYFDSLYVMSHLWTLIIYIAVGAGILVSYGARRSSVSTFEDDIAAEHND